MFLNWTYSAMEGLNKSLVIPLTPSRTAYSTIQYKQHTDITSIKQNTDIK